MDAEEQAFLKDLQASCLKEMDEYLNAFRESLADFKTNPSSGIRSIQKALHSMKGNLQAVAYSHYGELVHEIENVLDKCESAVTRLGQQVSEASAQELEYLLSSMLDAMVSYQGSLRETGSDSEELKNRYRTPLADLAKWNPMDGMSQERRPPQPAPSANRAVAPAAPRSSQKTKTNSPPPKASETHLFLLLQNGERYFAVAIEHIVEIIKNQPLSTPPCRKQVLTGLVNLRGDVLPILKIKEIMPEASQKPVYIVISMIQDQQFGFQIEEVHQVISLARSSFQPVAALATASHAGAISHFCRMEDKTISILQLEGLLVA